MTDTVPSTTGVNDGLAGVFRAIADGLDAGLPAIYCLTDTTYGAAKVQVFSEGTAALDAWLGHFDPGATGVITKRDWQANLDRYAATVDVAGWRVEFYTSIPAESARLHEEGGGGCALDSRPAHSTVH